MAKLSNVNTTDIRAAIELGCRTMCNVFNADDNDIPFMASSVRPVAQLSFTSSCSEAHIPGRHLNALLNAEDVAGISIDEQCIEKHARAAFFSYKGPVPLPLNRDEIGGPLVNFIPHNCREGFHALYALVKYRDSARARELVEASIAAIFEYWSPDSGWDVGRLTDQMGLNVGQWGTECDSAEFITGLARSIGPLVKLYRATGYGPALQLAILLKEKAIAEVFTEQGTFDPAVFGTHVHSVTCVMSSLAQLADLTTDSTLMNRVKTFFDTGLGEVRDELGWSIEGASLDSPPERGEANNTGDILETALILGRWGYAECYHDAERILRGHLLPCQLRDISFIEEPPNPEGEDGKHNVAQRHLGAFGLPAIYGHQPIGVERVSFNMDIVGGAVGSLCEAYREVTRFDGLSHYVNLLFDHETEMLNVQSPYTHDSLTITVKRSAPLFVRIPPWAKPEYLSIQGSNQNPIATGAYLFFAQPPVGRTITINFPLPEQEMALEHRTRTIRARLRGDEVVAMENFGADLTYFNCLE